MGALPGQRFAFKWSMTERFSIFLLSEMAKFPKWVLATPFILLTSISLGGANKGFQGPDSKDCSATAHLARQSTFRIILPTADQISIKQAFGQDTPELRANLVATLKSRNLPAPSADDVNRWQIERCLQDKTEDCFFSKTYTSATMVLIGDGRQALTAFHNIKLLLSETIAQGSQQGFSNLTISQSLNRSALPLFVYNDQGKLIASPNDLTAQLQEITAEQVEVAARNLASNDYHSAFDRVSLKFSRSLGTGVKIASKLPKPGETVRLFGYPAATADRKKNGANDSNGQSFYCTVGTVLSPDEVARRIHFNLSKLSAIEEMLYRQETIFATNDAVGGNSGGPLLNSEGELVAVLSRGNNEPLSSVATSKIVVPKTTSQIANNP